MRGNIISESTAETCAPVVLNQDLWEALKKEEDRLKKSSVKVTWKYVPGHSGVSMNERADVIATMCADNAKDLILYRGPKNEYVS